MAYRNTLRVSALLTLLLITEAMHDPAMKAAVHDMRFKVHKALADLQNESPCKHKEATAVHSIGCLPGLRNDFTACQYISVFRTYLTQASNLDILTLVTERLQEINQEFYYLQKALCTSEPEVNSCDTAFTESDGDYEKVCKVVSLLHLLKQWLHT